VLLHEASHYSLFPRRSWNNLAEIAIGLPFYRTCQQFRQEHKVHHASLGKCSDPLTSDYEAHGLFNPNVNITWIWFFKPVLGYAGYYYCRALSLRPWAEGRKIVAFWVIVFSLLVYVGALKFLFLYWLVPFYWCCMSFLYWSEITDHYRAPTGIRSNLSRLKNLLHHNNGYHYVHHHYPAIPWYRLPEAMRALSPEGGDACISFVDTYRALRRRPV
jgi:fatty acid desaturase